MFLPDDWVIASSPALAQRPSIIGLPLVYAALLITLTLALGLILHQVGAALYLLAFGWVLGKLVTYYDPFAWELLGKATKIPRIMKPT